MVAVNPSRSAAVPVDRCTCRESGHGKGQYAHMARCEGGQAYGSLLMAHLCASRSGCACCPRSSAPGRCSSTRRTQCPPRGSTSFSMSTRRVQGHQRACAEAISAPCRLCSVSEVGSKSISTERDARPQRSAHSYKSMMWLRPLDPENRAFPRRWGPTEYRRRMTSYHSRRHPAP